jgi:histidinol-phosphate aminotransferase
MGLEPLPSRTNFQVIRLNGRGVVELVAALEQRGYLVKGPFTASGLADCIRVTLGGPELMEQFAGVLADVLADPAP